MRLLRISDPTRCAALLLLLVSAAHAGFSCLSNPCHEGVCVDALNSSFTCFCVDGFTGAQCQTNWDECWSAPCLNGARCIDGVANFTCQCLDGFMGTLCEEDRNECASNPCLNNGTCLDAVNGYTCLCPPGYSGVFCETDVAVCNATEETRCLNGGVCREGPGVSFTCLCPPGWEGPLCQHPVDECASAPCMNGGVCLDLHADYACACLFGFTGKACEAAVHACEASPCDNGALCLVEAGVRVCYCVPDFHGERCHLQYDECQRGPQHPDKPPRCQNGGTCQDGVDQFTCSCPAGLTGPLCECRILEDGEVDCTPPPSTTPSWESPSTDVDLLTSTFWRDAPSSTSTDLLTTTTYQWTRSETMMTETDAEPTEETTLITTTESTEEVDTTPMSTILTSEEGDTTTLSIATEDESTTETSRQGEDEMFTSPESPSEHTTATSDDLGKTSTWSPSEGEITTWASTSAASDDEPTTFESMAPSSPEGFTIPAKSSDATTAVWTEAGTDSRGSPSTPELPLPDTTSTIFDITHITEFPNMTEHSAGTSIESSDHDAPTITEPSQQGGTFAFGSTEEVPTLLTDATERAATFSTDSTGQTGMYPTGGFPTWGHTSTSRPTPKVDEVTPHDEGSTSHDEGTTSYDEEVSGTTTEATPMPATTEMPDCSETPCLNKGICVFAKEGPRCVCKFGWHGPLCADPLSIKVAAFSGHSYITHRLPTAAPRVRVELSLRTLAPDGLVFCASLAPAHACCYMAAGRVNLRFTCGRQSMLLSETHMRIDTGYSLDIRLDLTLQPATRQCAAELRLNATLGMRGEQTTPAPTPAARRPGWLHLGGVPVLGVAPALRQHLPDVVGFTGCMRALKIDATARNILSDGVDGAGVTECTSLACLTAPCGAGATCVDYEQRFMCLCPQGLLGDTCERSVCENNPCLYGASCVRYPGAGFLCLCPLGRRGALCEYELRVDSAMLAPTAGGLAAFVAYPLSVGVHHAMELRFKFTAATLDQVALLAFVGQDGRHDSRSDHLAVSLVQGHVVLTWNLGSGPRRIFTARPVADGVARVHSVRVGRAGRSAWLAVDALANVSGSAPGRMQQLNTRSPLFIGGHEAVNFSGLPHDLPLHSGFAGCVYDVRLRGGRAQEVVLSPGTLHAWGRGVAQCGASVCSTGACLHGGVCLPHGPSFTCLCATGWFGATCAMRHNPCDGRRHACASSAVCVPTATGYECDCALGTTGRHCHKAETLSDVSFSGRRSYLSLVTPAQRLPQQSSVELEVRPTADALRSDCVILFQRLGARGFLALSLHAGVLELRLHTGPPRRVDDVVVVRARWPLTASTWHNVHLGRYGRRIFLQLDELVSTTSLPPGQDVVPAADSHLFLGGVPDLSSLPIGVTAGWPTPFVGCVRRLAVDWHRTPLDASNVAAARNVRDCDGTPCGGDLCDHGGHCLLVNNTSPVCSCPSAYGGPRCELQLPCSATSCLHGGRCEFDASQSPTPRCRCPAGWTGATCHEAVQRGAPHFAGDGHLVLERPAMMAREPARGLGTLVFVNFSTVHPDGLILWGEAGEDALGVGVEAGLLKVVAAHGSEPQNDKSGGVAVLTGPAVADGAWHALALSSEADGNLSLTLDGNPLHLETGLPVSPIPASRFYLGGIPEGVTVTTKGSFTSGFVGCVSSVAWSDELVTDFSSYRGENVDRCLGVPT